MSKKSKLNPAQERKAWEIQNALDRLDAEIKELELESSSELNEFDITAEAYREYDFNGRVYRIEEPVTLYYRMGGFTHRVLDSEGTVHCVPGPGNGNCVLRWKNKEGFEPCQF
jgi:hypothetical protein